MALNNAIHPRLARSFYDCDGVRRWARKQSLRQISEVLYAQQSRRTKWCADCQVVPAGETEVSLDITAAVPDGACCGVSARDEDGNVLYPERRLAPSSQRVMLQFSDPLATGYVTVELMVGDKVSQTHHLIVAPQKCNELAQGQKAQVLSVMLYGLPPRSNWGIGDFSSLREIARSALRGGYSYVLLNPLHLIFFEQIRTVSPYSPQSRTLLNWIYIDVERVPGYSPDVARFASATDRQPATIDYTRTADRKRRALSNALRNFKTQSGYPEFEDYSAFVGDRCELISQLVRAVCKGVKRKRSSGKSSFSFSRNGVQKPS